MERQRKCRGLQMISGSLVKYVPRLRNQQIRNNVHRNKCEDGGEKYPDHGTRAVRQQRGPWTFIMRVPWRHVPDARLVTGRVFSGRQPPQPPRQIQ